MYNPTRSNCNSIEYSLTHYQGISNVFGDIFVSIDISLLDCIDKLVLKGFVKKEINPENKRKLNLSITDSGLNVLIKLDDLINQIEIDIISNLNKKETRELNKLLEKIRLIAN